MNVLMLAPGKCIHSQRPLEWLLRAKCKVTFVDHHDPAPALRDGYRFVRYPGWRDWRSYRWLGWRLGTAVAIRSLTARLRWIKRMAGADVVHVHWVDERAYQCAQAGLKPLILTVWGSDVNALLSMDADSHARQVAGKALAAADLVLVDAPDMPAKCAELAGRPVPIGVLPLGIDTRRFRPCEPEIATKWRTKLSISADAAVFVSLRAMAPLYGHHLILEAFADAVGRTRRPAALVFKVYNQSNYPGSEEYVANLRRKAAELGITHLVRWVHEVPHAQLPEIYAFADAIVNYPPMDGFPVTFLEAAACQCPVVTVQLPPYHGSFAEEFFRLVSPDAPKGLADALVDYAEGGADAARTRMGLAREIIEQDHDESVSARRLLEHYKRLARPRHDAAPVHIRTTRPMPQKTGR